MISPGTTWKQIWATLHEPRIITFVVVLFYTFQVIFSGTVFWISMHDDHSWIPDSIAFVTGLILFISGAIGVPAAWRGDWWLERGSTLLTSLAGILVFFGTTCALFEHQEAIDKPVAWFSLLGAVAMFYVGVNRWFRVGLDPYAPGKGPLLPNRRIQRARDIMVAQTNQAKEFSLSTRK